MAKKKSPKDLLIEKLKKEGVPSYLIEDIVDKVDNIGPTRNDTDVEVIFVGSDKNSPQKCNTCDNRYTCEDKMFLLSFLRQYKLLYDAFCISEIHGFGELNEILNNDIPLEWRGIRVHKFPTTEIFFQIIESIKTLLSGKNKFLELSNSLLKDPSKITPILDSLEKLLNTHYSLFRLFEDFYPQQSSYFDGEYPLNTLSEKDKKNIIDSPYKILVSGIFLNNPMFQYQIKRVVDSYIGGDSGDEVYLVI